MIIIVDLRRIEWEHVDLIHMVPDRNQWRALSNTKMKLLVP